MFYLSHSGTSLLSCTSRFFSISPGISHAPTFLLLFLTLPGNPAYTSYLAIGDSAFCYANRSNTPSHSVQASHNTPVRTFQWFYATVSITACSKTLTAPPKALDPSENVEAFGYRENLWRIQCWCLVHRVFWKK